MDDAWGWGILFTVAALLSGACVPMAIQMRAEQKYQTAWVWVMASSLPLVIWTVMWVEMSNPTDGWRRAVSLIVGGIAGATLFVGATELWHQRAQAQQPPPASASSTPTLTTPAPQPLATLTAPHDNTFYGNIQPGLSGLAQGSNNTVVGPTDANGNTIINQPTIVGSHACGGPNGVVIGSHAGGAGCEQPSADKQ
jgi:hypothetical protein